MELFRHWPSQSNRMITVKREPRSKRDWNIWALSVAFVLRSDTASENARISVND